MEEFSHAGFKASFTGLYWKWITINFVACKHGLNWFDFPATPTLFHQDEIWSGGLINKTYWVPQAQISFTHAGWPVARASFAATRQQRIRCNRRPQRIQHTEARNTNVKTCILPARHAAFLDQLFDYAFNFFTNFGIFKPSGKRQSIRTIAQSLKQRGFFADGLPECSLCRRPPEHKSEKEMI